MYSQFRVSQHGAILNCPGYSVRFYWVPGPRQHVLRTLDEQAWQGPSSHIAHSVARLHVPFPGYLFLFFYYLFWERESARECEGRGGGQGERETQNPKQGSRLWAVSPEPDAGLELVSVRLWPESMSDTQLTEPPRRRPFLAILMPR